MATASVPNIDDQGNFLSPKVIARLIEKFGERAGEGDPAITPNMTFNQAAALGAQTDGA